MVRKFLRVMLVAGLFLLACVSTGFYETVVSCASENDIEEIHTISHEKGRRSGPITDYDATNKHLYLAYGQENSVIDAYGLDGRYAFTIILADKEHGGISIRCEDDRLYVSSKYNNVFVFCGSELDRKMDYETASELGYSNSWFSEKTRKAVLRGAGIYTLDENGQMNLRIPVSYDIIWHMYSRFVPIIGFGVILCLFCYRHNKENKNRHRNNLL